MSRPLEQARAHFDEGLAHFGAGRLQAAAESFEAALQLAPGRPSVLGNLGITLFRLGRLQRATDILQQAVQADPAHAEARVCLGLAHELLGHWEAAAEALERGLVDFDAGAGAWLALGRALGRSGRLNDALRALDHAVAQEEYLAEAWSVRGNVLRDMGRLQEAAESFRRAIDAGADPELHRYYLAASQGDTVVAPPRCFVESLFDEYSADFDEHLVDKLGYRGHEQLLQPLLDKGRRYRHALDLGCGTGLCGALMASHADAVDGVDLSAAMLQQARKRGAYRRLAHDDLTSFLAAQQDSADLVVAADVFIYVGALHEVFAQVRRVLAPDGVFAFTLERATTAQGFQLLPTLRYAHSEDYVRSLAAQHGLSVIDIVTAGLRADQAETLQALYVYLQPDGHERTV
ncbi:MAG: tetratricopeptide repeat protein [Pseudazoarcus pumilus]|nr:tetratricopeptide repeat protein [Pseudazoarcus pumilus]